MGSTSSKKIPQCITLSKRTESNNQNTSQPRYKIKRSTTELPKFGLGVKNLKSAHNRRRSLDENPDIIFEVENISKPVLPAYLSNIDITNITVFFTSSEAIQGKWNYLLNKNRIEFDENSNKTIEKAFITGQNSCKIILNQKEAKIKFLENSLWLPESNDSYKLARESSASERFWWQAADGSYRPLVKKIEEILTYTDGEFPFLLDGEAFHISIHKKKLVELCTGIEHIITLR
ncbi:unnamed protein product [Blepharisma stoltei]|uniref:Uncharacterized protein n=1 Tax=Blepharisma stoltei TaxID=1481888 RepID=A0AAU9JGU2_9CILI|nr:unnamed protein product [Blepharisma stoltei]